MLRVENTVLLVVDVQGKLASLMHDKRALFENIKKCIKGAKVFEIPILWVEQNPNGLGKTVPEIAGLLKDEEPIAKMSFSAYRNEEFKTALKNLDRNQVVIVGIETHVCVYQSAVDLVHAGYEVSIVANAVSSRKPGDKQIGIQRMKDEGVKLTGTEMALFELLEVAEGARFKQILEIVK